MVGLADDHPDSHRDQQRPDRVRERRSGDRDRLARPSLEQPDEQEREHEEVGRADVNTSESVEEREPVGEVAGRHAGAHCAGLAGRERKLLDRQRRDEDDDGGKLGASPERDDQRQRDHCEDASR